jgi:hypothetical protein
MALGDTPSRFTIFVPFYVTPGDDAERSKVISSPPKASSGKPLPEYALLNIRDIGSIDLFDD